MQVSLRESTKDVDEGTVRQREGANSQLRFDTCSEREARRVHGSTRSCIMAGVSAR